MAVSSGRAAILSAMEMCTRGPFTMDIVTDMESWFWRMGKFMKENGNWEEWMVRGLISGLMEKSMRDRIKKGSNMEEENIFFLMARFMKVSGLKACSMGKVL